MSVDVLSEAHSAPIIVGDDADMDDLQGVGRDEDGRFHLMMAGKPVPLSPVASTNFETAEHLLLVRLAPGDEICAAHKVRLDNIADGQELSPEQRAALAKALSLGGPERKFHTEALAEFRRANPDLAAA